MKLVMACDDNYLLPSLVLLYSLFSDSDARQYDTHVNFGYVEGALSSESQSALKDLAERLGFEFQLEKFPNPSVPGKRHISNTTLLKFSFLSNQSEPLLWLDTDMVAAEGSWSDLHYLLSDLNGEKRFLVAARPGPKTEKFNAGMFGSKSRISIDWKSKLSESESSFEQHIFQEAFLGQSFQCDSKYNAVHFWGGESFSGGVIYHFTGPIKPWHMLEPKSRARCQSRGCDWSHWYLKYEALTLAFPEIVRLAESLVRRPVLSTRLSRLLINNLHVKHQMNGWSLGGFFALIRVAIRLVYPWARLNVQSCHPFH